MHVAERIVRGLRLIEPKDKLIRVKSWWPSPDKYGVAWPLMLVQKHGGPRWTCAPIWNMDRLRALFGRAE